MTQVTGSGTDKKFIIGLDLGQANDFTGIVVLERLQDWYTELVPLNGRDRYVVKKWHETHTVKEPIYHARHVERLKLGTPYPEVIEYVKQLVNTGEIAGNYALIVDQTGVGRPVFELALKAGLNAVGCTITGGDSVTWKGKTVRVAKRILVSTVSAVMQTGRLKFAKRMESVEVLQKELLDFRVKVTDNANDIYSAREGQHDDLVLSLAMALWIGEAHANKTNQVATQYRYF